MVGKKLSGRMMSKLDQNTILTSAVRINMQKFVKRPSEVHKYAKNQYDVLVLTPILGTQVCDH
jgi:hypothetical protein